MSTTADVCGHVLSETLADATERLAAAWGGSQETSWKAVSVLMVSSVTAPACSLG